MFFLNYIFHFISNDFIGAIVIQKLSKSFGFLRIMCLEKKVNKLREVWFNFLTVGRSKQYRFGVKKRAKVIHIEKTYKLMDFIMKSYRLFS